MNMKEIADKVSKRPRFTSGHRMCGGCATPIIVKSILAATNKPVVAATATGCLEVASTIYPYSSWDIPWIHSAFENAASTISGVEAAYKAMKRKGKVKEDIKFIAFGGDGGTYDIGLQALSGALERGHDFVYVCYDNEAYMNCLARDALIMTEKGLRLITGIKKGDTLFSFDPYTHQISLRKCAGVYDNGVKEVFEVETLHHTLKATGNHPFLTVKHGGRGKETTLVWKTVENLRQEDEVVVSKGIGRGQSFEFRSIKKRTKRDYKVKSLNYVRLPKKSSPKLMKYLGIYLGDGWIRKGRGDIGFSLPAGSEERRILIKLHKEIFRSRYTENKNEVHISSVNLSRFIDSLGFGSGAKNKEVPDWVFTLPLKEKEAFVEGLLLSDGYEVKNSGSKRYVSASMSLLNTLRLLLQTMNYRVGKIHSIVTRKGTKVVKRELLKDSLCGYICFSKLRKWNVGKYPSQYKYANYLIGNQHFSVEKVKKTTSMGREPTLDLQVEESHNFMANGFVVHNTGGQRSSATPFGASATTEPAGKVKPGKEVWRKDLVKICAAHNIPYAAQASVSNLIDLTSKAAKAFEAKGPAVLVVLSTCPTLWGTKPEMTIETAKLAVESCFWPLYEIVDGEYRISYKPAKKIPVVEFMKPQRRFKHLFIPGNEHIVEKIQQHVDSEWKKLLSLCAEK